MPTMFAGEDGRDNRGRVVLLDQPGLPGSIITLGNRAELPLGTDSWGGFERFKSIFTRLSIIEQPKFQVTHMFGGDIYLYTFGDNISKFSLTGLSFYDTCNSDDDRIGLVHVIDYYRANRLSQRQSALKVTIEPDKTFTVYLSGLRGSTANTAQRLFQFTFNFILVPDDEIEIPFRRPTG